MNAGAGEASQARHQMGAQVVVVRFTNRGLGCEPSESSPTSDFPHGNPGQGVRLLFELAREQLHVTGVPRPEGGEWFGAPGLAQLVLAKAVEAALAVHQADR